MTRGGATWTPARAFASGGSEAVDTAAKLARRYWEVRDVVPAITDPSTAARDIPLATLSAITHGKDDNAAAILKALAAALKTIDEETARIFAEFTELGLGTAPAAKIWRHLMSVDLSFFRSETSQRLRAEGPPTCRSRHEYRLIIATIRHRSWRCRRRHKDSRRRRNRHRHTVPPPSG